MGFVFLFATLGAAFFVRHLYNTRRQDVGPGAQYAAEYLGRAAVEEAHVDGRKPLSFYVYRAGSKASYPLDNVNVADLAGVMWYLHNEVVVSTPRKYAMDRIRRYKLTVKNTQEFWNVHHRNFGAFVAFDAARCTTPICGSIYSSYGFIVGCQVLSTDVAPYLGDDITLITGACKGRMCNAPVWYSLPGACPIKGLTNDQISGNSGAQDVTSAKGATCIKEQPGGRCDSANGAPDCTFSVEDAGEIMLDDLSGIQDYDRFWNGSFVDCEREVRAGTRLGPCFHNKEFDLEKDHGTGCSFWDGKADIDNATRRMKAVRDLFKKRFPDMPYDLKEPACDFDMYYDGEKDWPINHTGAIAPKRGFSWSKAADMRKTTTTPPSAAGADEPTMCKDVGCGSRGAKCDCNSMCKKYNDCCADYEDLCVADSSKSHSEVAHAHANATKAEEAGSAIDSESHHRPEAPKLSKACREAWRKCSKSITWAKTHGFFEHPEWYKGLDATSPDDDFQKLLAKTKHGGCDKVCPQDNSHVVFLKKK